MLKIITVGLKIFNDFCFGFERFSLKIFGAGDENKDDLRIKTTSWVRAEPSSDKLNLADIVLIIIG